MAIPIYKLRRKSTGIPIKKVILRKPKNKKKSKGSKYA